MRKEDYTPDSLLYQVYYRFNPIIHLVMRPTLRLVNAHEHPIIGGFAAALASLLAHYALACVFYWDNDLVTTILGLSRRAHFLLAFVAIANIIMGFIKATEAKEQNTTPPRRRLRPTRRRRYRYR